jgi:hypothetical protein
MAELIAAGTTEADSADFTLASGDQVTLFLKDAAGPRVASDAVAHLQIKSAAGEYFHVGHLDSYNPAKVLAAPGTYRVKRLAASAAYGVDKV